LPKRQAIIPREMQYLVDRAQYHPGLRVGDMLFVAGQVGRDDNGNIVAASEAQMVQAFENARKVLATAGLGFEHVVDMTTYHVGLQGHRELFKRVKDRYITRDFPCWTAIGVHELSTPGMIIEIKLIAAYPD